MSTFVHGMSKICHFVSMTFYDNEHLADIKLTFFWHSWLTCGDHYSGPSERWGYFEDYIEVTVLKTVLLYEDFFVLQCATARSFYTRFWVFMLYWIKRQYLPTRSDNESVWQCRTYVSTNRMYVDICSTWIATNCSVVPMNIWKTNIVPTSGLENELSILKMFKLID
jgi:hypothetical protein